MFRRISYKIAFQFTGFVFLMLLVNGMLFLVADFNNARHQSKDRLTRTFNFIANRTGVSLSELIPQLPPPDRERIRIIDGNGKALYSGGLFQNIPFEEKEGFTELEIGGEQYRIFTASIRQGIQVAGYLQIGDIERLQQNDLPFRALLYLMLSGSISMLTFIVGLYFARRSLAPAAQMVQQLEQFTQDASHELRTPIAVLSSSLDLALKSGKHEEGIASAKEDLKQIAALVERLLELARLDTFTLERNTVDFSGLISQSVEKHKILADDNGVAVEADVAAGVLVTGDEASLRQVIANLLSNAVKFTPSNGKVKVKLTKNSLSVEDSGIGIDAKDLPNIFDRFYQADSSRARGGLGLGLALVKRIVELHGWSINVKSQKNKGTAFVIHFTAGGRQKRS